MLKLSVSSHLEIAHYMPDFPEGHPNRRMHGHSYFVTVTLESVDDTDMIEDLEVLQTKVEEILKKYDHTCANDWDLPTDRKSVV